MNRLLAKIPDPRRGELGVTYAYNTLGLRTNMTDASGVTSYVYDNRNRLFEKDTPQGVLNYGYDALGNLQGIQSGNANGAWVTYEYDALNRLSTVNDTRSGRTTYNYDPVGNLRACNYANDVTSLHQYDALNRLTNLGTSKLLVLMANYAYTVGASGQRLTATETTLPNGVPRTINRVFTYDDLPTQIRDHRGRNALL